MAFVNRVHSTPCFMKLCRSLSLLSLSVILMHCLKEAAKKFFFLVVKAGPPKLEINYSERNVATKLEGGKTFRQCVADPFRFGTDPGILIVRVLIKILLNTQKIIDM